MATVSFTANIQRHVECPPCEAAGRTLREALDSAFAGNSRARGYVLDDRGALRKHIAVFINGRLISDQVTLTDAVNDDDHIYIMQALSGG